MNNVKTLIENLNRQLKANPIKANCFNAVELFWKDASAQRFLQPEECVAYIVDKFKQISLTEKFAYGDVAILWSRSEDLLQVGKISVEDLLLKRPGYPFGLIIEHAFVYIDDKHVFQKADPKPTSLYQITSVEEALQPYINLKGFEITHHKRK